MSKPLKIFDEVYIVEGLRYLAPLIEWFHTPGSISILLKTKDGNILFAQDVHGPFLPEFGSNLVDWGNQ